MTKMSESTGNCLNVLLNVQLFIILNTSWIQLDCPSNFSCFLTSKLIPRKNIPETFENLKTYPFELP